jgi:hypothetical protein
MQCYYENIGNQYALMDQEQRLINIFDDVGIAYSIVDGVSVIHMHGDAQRIKKWYNDSVFNLARQNQHEQIRALHCITSSSMSCHELNHCLENPSYVELLAVQTRDDLTKVAKPRHQPPEPAPAMV